MDQYGVAYNSHLGEHLQVVALGYCSLCLEVSCLCLAETRDGVKLCSVDYQTSVQTSAWHVVLNLRYRV